MAEGWKCPGCGRSWAPHVEFCRKCDGEGAGSVDSVQNRAPAPVIAALWDEHFAVAKTKLAEGTQRSRVTYRETFATTKLKYDDGTEGPILELPYDRVTARVAELFRIARESTDNGQGGTVCGGTVNRELGALSAVLQWHADVKKSIPSNPMKGWGRHDESGDARQTYLTPEQARAFIAAGNPLFQDVATVAYRCAGMRNAEARMLKKSEVDFTGMVINLPSSRNKNGKPRVVPFPSDVAAILRRHADNSRGPYIFVAPADPQRCRPIPQSTFQSWITQARDRSGIVGFDGEKVVLHTLRHCAVTDLLQAKIDQTSVMAVAAMSPRTLQRYSKFGPVQQENFRKHLEEQLEPPAERAGPRRAPSVRPGRLSHRR